MDNEEDNLYGRDIQYPQMSAHLAIDAVDNQSLLYEKMSLFWELNFNFI